jgi:hypothetical protein
MPILISINAIITMVINLLFAGLLDLAGIFWLLQYANIQTSEILSNREKVILRRQMLVLLLGLIYYLLVAFSFPLTLSYGANSNCLYGVPFVIISSIIIGYITISSIRNKISIFSIKRRPKFGNHISNVLFSILAIVLIIGMLLYVSNLSFKKPTTDQEVIQKFYGRRAAVNYGNQGRVVALTCPKVRGDSPLRFITILYPRTCIVKTPLPPEIGQLTALDYLTITGSERLTILPPEIGQLTNLKSLNLSENNLTSLTPEIGQLTNLDRLIIRGNNLADIPPEIGQLTDLRILDLSGNNITALPSEIGELANLEELYLDSNALTTLPAEIGQLTNLRILSLERNNLTVPPPEIGRLTKLEALNLRINDLSALPPEIGRLKNLKKLDVSYNALQELPPEIGQLTNLEELEVTNNNLTALPSELGWLTNLKKFYYFDNPVTLPANLYSLEERLEYLRNSQ